MSTVPNVSESVTVQPGAPAATSWISAALIVAAGQSASVAAAAAGVHERTIRRWLKRPSFKAAVEEIRGQMLGDLLGRLLARTGAAVDTLGVLLTAPENNVRLGAAGRILDLALRTRKELDTEKKLEEIEDTLECFKREHPEFFGQKGENGNGGQAT